MDETGCDVIGCDVIGGMHFGNNIMATGCVDKIRGEWVSVVGAMTRNGVLCLQVVHGTVTGDVFHTKEVAIYPAGCISME